MQIGRQWIGGIFCAAAVALVAPTALARQQTSAPLPSPTPSRTPMVITLPGVVPERYSLPGGTPVPVPAAPSIVVPASTPTPSAATPTAQASRAEQRPARAPVRPAAVASPTPAPTATPGPIPKSPAAIVAPSPAAVTAPLPQAAQPGMPGWLWMLIGAIVTAALGGAAWALSRQRQDPEEEGEKALPLEEVVRPRVVPPAPAPAPGILRSAPPPPPPVSRPQSDPFDIVVRPSRIELGPREVVLEFELMVGNIQSGSAEGIRVALATISASPDQDRMIAAFHRGPPMEAGGEPFDLGPGSGARIPARLSLPREHVHVVQVGDRPMFVAMLMIDLRWRSGLSICRFGSDFMIGTAGQGGKIGPFWLDRGPPAGPLGATRYLPREAAAA